MDVMDAIKGRRSIRGFKGEPVDDKDLEKILDAARWAPSAGGMQPLELVVIKDPAVKQRLVNASRNQDFIGQAPVVVVVCADVMRTKQRYGDRGSGMYVIQDTAAAAQNMHIVAHSLGYATCWVGAFDEPRGKSSPAWPRTSPSLRSRRSRGWRRPLRRANLPGVRPMNERTAKAPRSAHRRGTAGR